ncbi:AMP-binding protein [Acidilobus sp. 7A]|uniref:AMP-binding protein n=1 Tax=Acidilobus sp. 7A TaxID=1577685 RepID=UPI000764E5CB|nr:AMP-binding protein [Acidilobus sp. 7A]AMD31104.1 AMP-dependent synthetase [Acidilobus sp. 7A]
MTYIWTPPKDVVDKANVTGFIQAHGIKSYQDLVRQSTSDIRWFWGNLPDWLELEWFSEPKDVYDASKGIEWTRWYIGGRINVAYNVLDRIVKRGLGNRVAMTWIGEDDRVVQLTYNEMLDHVNRFSNLLVDLGVKKGDVVAIYAPIMPETVVAMLASMRVGAIASPIFSGFAPEAVADRLRMSEAKVVVTVDGYYRKGKVIKLKPSSDEAIRLSGVQAKQVVVRRLNVDVPWDESRDLWYDKAIASKRPEFEPAETEAEDPAILMFTSGTTGKPKGAVISHAGMLLQPTKEHFFNLDIKPGWTGSRDVLWWITDLGWMMGPWMVVGSQTLGASHLSLEGALDYPTKDRVWAIIEKFKVTHLGFAATAARLLKALGRETYESHDLSSLRAFGNTGEPIDEDTWNWVVREVGEERRPMINLSGGTEIMGCFLLPSPVVPLKPTTLWGPGLGMDVDVYDDDGMPVRGRPGYLVAKKPAPSMTRGLWRDPERYIETYWSRFPGVWYHGDYALIDEDGFWYILGRADDVIKVAGKRIGPAEIETIINSHPDVAESACIGYPHPVKGEVIVCFALPKPGRTLGPEQLEQIKSIVAQRLGKPFEPEAVVPVNDLPRTRSGKIMRRIVRDAVLGKQVEQTPVLDNPDSVTAVKEAAEELKKLMK